MNNTDNNATELKVVYVGNLELSAIGKLDEVKDEFWKRSPANELRMHTHQQNSHLSATYLFLSHEDAKLFGELLTSRNITFFYHLDSKFDDLATMGMGKEEKEEYFSRKLF